MEPPASFDADELRNEKVKVAAGGAGRIAPGGYHRGQYEGYLLKRPVSRRLRKRPTFAALRLYIDNWRWQGVTVLFALGEIVGAQSDRNQPPVQTASACHVDLPGGHDCTPNLLSLCIQPDESIRLRFETKIPGSPHATRTADMTFSYREVFGKNAIPEAYELLLMDALQGNASLFTRNDEIRSRLAHCGSHHRRMVQRPTRRR